MRAAKSKDEPPPDLPHLWRCQRWGGLPKVGAVEDQDYIPLRRMELLGNIYDAVKAWRKGNISPEVVRIVGWLTKAKLMGRGIA